MRPVAPSSGPARSTSSTREVHDRAAIVLSVHPWKLLLDSNQQCCQRFRTSHQRLGTSCYQHLSTSSCQHFRISRHASELSCNSPDHLAVPQNSASSTSDPLATPPSLHTYTPATYKCSVRAYRFSRVVPDFYEHLQTTVRTHNLSTTHLQASLCTHGLPHIPSSLSPHPRPSTHTYKPLPSLHVDNIVCIPSSTLQQSFMTAVRTLE